MTTIVPDQIILAVTREELNVIRAALIDYRGPFEGDQNLSKDDLKHQQKQLAIRDHMYSEASDSLMYLEYGGE